MDDYSHGDIPVLSKFKGSPLCKGRARNFSQLTLDIKLFSKSQFLVYF